jgi:hypothetical protein
MNLLQRQLEDPLRFNQIKRWFYIALAAVAAAEIVLPILWHFLKRDIHPPHFWFEWIPAWGSLYGLISCVVIIVVSKFLGKTWLMRREDYYDS